MGYRLAKAAETDIARIFRRGFAEFGVRQAENYHAGLERIFEFLASNPRAARERDEFAPAVRLHPLGVHVVVYRIVGDDIVIIRVLHGRQDWERWV